MPDPSAPAAFAVVQLAPNRYTVQGGLTFGTARRAVEAGVRAFASASGASEVDLGGVSASDSAGLAVLIEWLAWARHNGRTLKLANVPAAVLAIAGICEIDGLLRAG